MAGKAQYAGRFGASGPAELRKTTARHLLRLIRQHVPCSRADLVRLTGLSAPTVARCVDLLQQMRLVEAIGDGRSKGGRPPLLLAFNAQHSYVAAADVGGSRLRMMLADFSGEAHAEWSRVLERKHKTPAGVCALIKDGLKTMCATAGVPLARVRHLTAGAPGITNAHDGIVCSAPNLTQWTNVPLRKMLRATLRIPVAVENDVNLAAVGEHLWGAARGVDEFVFLALGTGLGAGIFFGGRLHQGSHWGAGELGYLGVSHAPRKPMKIEQTGQLESAIGGGGIETRYRRRLTMKKSFAAERMRLHAPGILDLAQQGDRDASRVAEETARWMADAIADLAVILDPKLVVLGGGVGAHPELVRLTAEALRRHELAGQLQIRSSELGTKAQLRGAVSVSLNALEDDLFR